MPVAVLVLICLVSPLVVLAETSKSEAVARMQLVERGEYLVTAISMCGYCHTPRDSKGRLVQYKSFQGAVIPVTPPKGTDWALIAPSNLGFVGYNDEDALRLLTEGIKRDVSKTKPPMPPYRFNQEDAEAVVAFLRSVR